MGLLLQHKKDQLVADLRWGAADTVNVFDRNVNYEQYQAYVQWHAKFGDRLSAQIGAFGLLHSLSNASTIEPRFNISWKPNYRQRLSFAYGQHAMTQPISIYLSGPKCLFRCNEEPAASDKLYNKTLDLSKSQQFSLNYQLAVSPSFLLKAEAYYQLYHNIVESVLASGQYTISSLNFGSSGAIFYPHSIFSNLGKGESKGIEVSLEGKWGKDFSIFASGSLYNATYTNSAQPSRNTAFNGKYNFNLLVDKRFMLHLAKKNILHISTAITGAGGRRFTPSQTNQPWIKDEERAFEAKYKDYFRTDLKLGLQQNFQSFSHTISLDIRNLFNSRNEYFRQYSRQTGAFVTYYQLGFLPLVYYQVTF